MAERLTQEERRELAEQCDRIKREAPESCYGLVMFLERALATLDAMERDFVWLINQFDAPDMRRNWRACSIPSGDEWNEHVAPWLPADEPHP